MIPAHSTRLREESLILSLTKTDEQGKPFLSKLNGDGSLLNEDDKARVEHLLVKYHSFFASQRSDIGIDTELKVKLTLQHEKPVFLKSLPTPTNLKEDFLVKLEPIQEYGIITYFNCHRFLPNVNRTAS